MITRKYSIWLFVAAVVVIPVMVYALLTWYQNKVQHLPVLARDREVLNFRMTNQQGKTVTLEDWKNKIVVVDFFFTHCPVICPKMTNNLKKVQQEFAGDDIVQISSFSVDPTRDSVGQFRDYISERKLTDQNWHFLTGDKAEIYRLARKSFLIVANDGDGGPTDFIHSEKFILVDPKGRIRGYYQGTSETETVNLINDIKKLKNEN